MQCIKCSRTIPDDAAFCSYCGKKQAASSEVMQKSVKKRGNGQGSVYKRGNKWCAAVTLGYYMEDGVRKRKVRKKAGFERKKDALAYIEELREMKTRPQTVTFENLWEKYQTKLASLSKSKRSAYKIAWNRISDEIRFRDVDEPTVSELQELMDLRGNSYYTKRDIKSLLSHLYKIAIMDDFADKNRAQYIQLPKLEQSEREVFTEDEINMLWASYQSGNMTAGHILIMLYTGIRPGELLTIKAENIHLEEHWMHGGIKTAKGKARKIIIPSCLEPIIEQSIRNSRKGLLAWYGHKTDFYDAWSELRSELKLRQELSPYCCRHTYITRLTALKVSPAMLQELAGHEDYETTLDYTHLSVAERFEEVEKLLHPYCTP